MKDNALWITFLVLVILLIGYFVTNGYWLLGSDGPCDAECQADQKFDLRQEGQDPR